MHRRAVTHLITLATLLSQSAGEIVTAPQSTESKVGDTSYFNCSTDHASKEIFWHHDDKYIYTGLGILEPYNGRFEIDRKASNGSHNLVIHSVQLSDAGEYICIDDDGHGMRRSAELVVLENDPVCRSNIQPDGVIGQNIFNISQDEVQLTCYIAYYGNIPPRVEWKKVGDNKSLNDNITSIVDANRFTYSLKLKGDISLDKSSYVCQTTRTARNQYKCTSEIIKVLYFMDGNTTQQKVVRGDKIACIASNSTFTCSSQWYHDNYTCPLACDQTITTHLLGTYLCIVKCHVRGNDYSFNPLKVLVAEATTSPPPFELGAIIAASVAVPLVVISVMAVLIAVFAVRSRERKESRRIRLIQLKEQTSNRNKPEYDVAEEEIEILCKIKKKGLPEDEKTIAGLTILDEQLFIMREESQTLEVYDINNLDHGRISLKIDEVVAAVDICSCKLTEYNCIYIMDKKDLYEDQNKLRARKVFKIILKPPITEGMRPAFKKWSTKGDACGFLSATKEGNVIITDQDKHMLLEYSTDGKWVRDINLPIRPWHAIKLDNDRYVVSHGTYDHLNRVCLVNKSGEVQKSFGGEMGSSKYQLHIPYYLAVSGSDCVFVADRCNNRVLLLDLKSELKCKAKILPRSEQRFRGPRRICLHEKYLVVVIKEKKRRNASEMNSLLSNPEERMIEDPLPKIEDDGPVLVFNNQQLKKYTTDGQHDRSE